jgi:hypothetical protein
VPIMTMKSLMQTISDQADEISQLKSKIEDLEAMLEFQVEAERAGELAALIFEHPEELDNVIIASTDYH